VSPLLESQEGSGDQSGLLLDVEMIAQANAFAQNQEPATYYRVGGYFGAGPGATVNGFIRPQVGQTFEQQFPHARDIPGNGNFTPILYGGGGAGVNGFIQWSRLSVMYTAPASVKALLPYTERRHRLEFIGYTVDNTGSVQIGYGKDAAAWLGVGDIGGTGISLRAVGGVWTVFRRKDAAFGGALITEPITGTPDCKIPALWELRYDELAQLFSIYRNGQIVYSISTGPAFGWTNFAGNVNTTDNTGWHGFYLADGTCQFVWPWARYRVQKIGASPAI